MKTILKHISRLRLVFYILFSLLYALQGLLTSFLIQMLGKIDVSNREVLGYFAFGGVLFFVFIYACMYINNVLVRAMIRDFNILVSAKAIRQFYKRQLTYSSSELNSFLTQDIPMFWQEYLAPLLILPIFALSIIASVSYLLIQNLLIGLMFTFGGFLMIIPQFVFHKMLQKRGADLSQARQVSLASITDFTKGIATIRSNQASEPFSKHLIATISETEKSQCRYFTSHNLVMFWTGPLKGMGLVLPLVIALSFIQSSHLSLTTLIAMMTASMNLISPLQQLLEASSSLQSASVVRDKMVAILSSDDDGEEEVVSFKSDKLSLSINRLNKAFDDKVIFQNASLNLPFGTQTLLTGASGCGKSTLFGLISGEDGDFEGEIYLEDDNGVRYAPSFDCVSLIHQKPYIFTGSLRDNLTLYQSFSNSRLEQVLRDVELWDELGQNLELQLDGQNLSGGQMMKLELARCLLRLKPILLVDEITAALDDDNATVVRQLIYAQNATVLEIAHNFNREVYDEVIVIDNGQLMVG